MHFTEYYKLTLQELLWFSDKDYGGTLNSNKESIIMSSNDQSSRGGPLGSMQSSGNDNSTVKSTKFLVTINVKLPIPHIAINLFRQLNWLSWHSYAK